MWALFYLSAGGYERTIKKMLKLMAGKMTSLAVSQLVSNCEIILFKQKNTGLQLWNDTVQTENIGLKYWSDIVPTEKCRSQIVKWYRPNRKMQGNSSSQSRLVRDDLYWQVCAYFSYDFAAFFCPSLRRKINCPLRKSFSHISWFN